MLLRKKVVLRFLCILTIVALMGSPILFAATEEVEIAGTVFASEWDANDNVTAVVIATEEGEEIAVSPSGKGRELVKLEDQEGRKTINITKYIVQE